MFSAGDDLMAVMVFSGVVFLMLLMLDINMGRLLGYRDTYLSDEETRRQHRLHNGYRTYYVMFIPLWERGFWHSTGLDDG